MSAATITCKRCGEHNRLWDPAPGKKVTCRKCGATLEWPAGRKRAEKPPMRWANVLWLFLAIWAVLVIFLMIRLWIRGGSEWNDISIIAMSTLSLAAILSPAIIVYAVDRVTQDPGAPGPPPPPATPPV